MLKGMTDTPYMKFDLIRLIRTICGRASEEEQQGLDLTTAKDILIAPLLEEFIYRACLINIFMETGVFSDLYCVLVLPSFFAISHLHHVF